MSGAGIYWEDGGADPEVSSPAELPKAVDVAVIGAGYTGLSTAFHLARAGRSVAVFEAGRIGAGGSSRNGGMIGPSFHKLGTAGLIGKFGETKTLALMQEGLNALDFFEYFVREEKLECDLQMVGRFRGARTFADYDAMARETAWLHENLGLDCDMVSESAQRDEIGSDAYRGGVLYHRDGCIHPRKLLLGLVKCTQDAGVQIFDNCAVQRMDHDTDKCTLITDRGLVRAAEVVIATNAYSDRRTAAMQKRVVRIETGAVATEPLSPAVMHGLTPKYRTFGESGRVFMWFRPTSDRTRFIFGGRMGRPGASAAQRSQAIRSSVLRVFPQLHAVSFSHVWSGNVGYTTDHAPHIGQEDGVWLAGGYCGSGVTRSLYFGMKLARKILKQPQSDTAFDDLPFKRVGMRPLAEFGARMLTGWYARQDAKDLRAAQDKKGT